MIYPYNYTMETERERLIRLRDGTGSVAVLTGLISLAKPDPTILGVTALLAIISFGAEVRLKQLDF